MNPLRRASNLVDTILDETEKRSDFDEPDRNTVDDIPDDNPEKTLKDIEKEVTESFIDFASILLDEGIESAAKYMADTISENIRLSNGEVERLKLKYTRLLSTKFE